MTAAVSIDQAR